MEYNGKEVYTEETFSYEKVQIGDYVDAKVVMYAMELLPPATMRISCAQVGEPCSHRQDPDTGKWRATYSTFKCVNGGWDKGVWEYCGECFLNETTKRGEETPYVGLGGLL